MTCGSCKIFFHRHAFESVVSHHFDLLFIITLMLKNQEQKRCLTGNGNCPVSHDIQRKCIRCRLQRCFAAGMTTDYFLTDEEKERRRKRYKNNPQMIDSSSLLSSTTFDEIDQVSNKFVNFHTVRRFCLLF